jgi:hypothetical protein
MYQQPIKEDNSGINDKLNYSLKAVFISLTVGIIGSIIGSFVHDAIKGYRLSTTLLDFFTYRLFEFVVWHIFIILAIFGFLIWFGCREINRLKKKLNKRDFEIVYSRIPQNQICKFEIFNFPDNIRDFDMYDFINKLYDKFTNTHRILYMDGCIKLFITEIPKDYGNIIRSIEGEVPYLSNNSIIISLQSQNGKSIKFNFSRGSGVSFSIDSVKQRHKTKEDFFKVMKDSHKSLIEGQSITNVSHNKILELVWKKSQT